MVLMTEIEKLKEDINILQMKLKALEEKSPAEEAFKKFYGRYPITDIMDTCWDGSNWEHFREGYITAKGEGDVVEPSMINCIIEGNPPDGYGTWHDWYEEMGSQGILHNLKISSRDYKPTPQERGDQIHKEVENEIEKLQEKNWYVDAKTLLKSNWEPKIKTPEEIEKSLREAFKKVQQTEEWKETQRKIDSNYNEISKNFKNSLDLIKEWGEKNKPPTLYEILMDWWINHLDMEQSDEEIIDGLVEILDKKFIPPSHNTNDYQWNKCLKIMRDKLR